MLSSTALLRRKGNTVRGVVVHRSLEGFSEANLPPVLSALCLLSQQTPRLLRARRGNARLGVRKGTMSGALVTMRPMDRFLQRIPAKHQQKALSALQRGQTMRYSLDTLLPRAYYPGSVTMSPTR